MYTRRKQRRITHIIAVFGEKFAGLMETVVLLELSSSPICHQSPWELRLEFSCTQATYKQGTKSMHMLGQKWRWLKKVGRWVKKKGFFFLFYVYYFTLLI